MLPAKFRAWDSERKLFIGSDYPGNWDSQKEELFANENKLRLTGIMHAEADANLTLEQSTGLLDETGTEIYQGDIVFVQYSKWYYNAIVEKDTENPCFVLHLQGQCNASQYDYDFSKARQMVLKVIGNVHQNRELIRPYSFTFERDQQGC